MSEEKKGLKAEDLKVGSWYRAKRPRTIYRTWKGEPNDRKILWIGVGQVQYDGPAVKLGSRYPKVDIDVFLRWAGTELSSEQMRKEGLMD